MDLDFSLPNLLLLLGALQGSIFSIILLIRKKHQAQFFLSIFILTLSYNAFESFATLSNLTDNVAFFDLFAFTTIFLLGPSFYLYLKTILFPDQKISHAQIIKHGSLFLFQVSVNLCLLLSYLLDSFQILNLNWEFSQIYGFFDLYSEPLSIIAFAGYLYLTYRLIKRVKTSPEKLIYPKAVKKTVLEWSKVLIITLTIFLTLWIVTYALPFFTESNPLGGYLFLEIALMFFIYWISFAAHHRMQQVHSYLTNAKESKVSKTEADLKIQQLQQVMVNDKPYLNPKITREILAKEIDLSPKKISSILNQHYGQSFNDFINEYRVSEVKASLGANKAAHKTISGIALDAGFNSQATFQRAFKKTAGMTPKEYIASRQKESIK